jgi:DNA-binding response OmpR family regulator
MGRILIVEDEGAIRELIRTTLSFSGHELVEAADGASALGVLETQPLDLVIMDLGLKGEPEGAELCRRVRQSRHGPRVVVVSGAGEEEERGALRAGAQSFLRKPFSPIELLSKVDEALGP